MVAPAPTQRPSLELRPGAGGDGSEGPWPRVSLPRCRLWWDSGLGSLLLSLTAERGREGAARSPPPCTPAPSRPPPDPAPRGGRSAGAVPGARATMLPIAAGPGRCGCPPRPLPQPGASAFARWPRHLRTPGPGAARDRALSSQVRGIYNLVTSTEELGPRGSRAQSRDLGARGAPPAFASPLGCITNDHGLPDINDNRYLLTVVEAASPRSRSRQGWSLLPLRGPLSWA